MKFKVGDKVRVLTRSSHTSLAIIRNFVSDDALTKAYSWHVAGYNYSLELLCGLKSGYEDGYIKAREEELELVTPLDELL